jgi:hypothetical protein
MLKKAKRVELARLGAMSEEGETSRSCEHSSSFRLSSTRPRTGIFFAAKAFARHG